MSTSTTPLDGGTIRAEKLAMTTFEVVLYFLLGFTAAFRTLQVGSIHFFTVIALVIFASSWSRKRTESGVLWLGLAVVLAVGLIDMSLLWPNRAVNPLLGVQFALLAVSSLAIARTVTREGALVALRGVLSGATLSSAVAILQQARVIRSELWQDSSGLVRPTGLVGEPDWAGFFAACALLLLLRGVIGRGWLWWISVGINSACVVLCLARASWLALAAALVLLVLVSLSKKGTPYPPIVGPRLFAAGGGVVTLVFIVDQAFREVVVGRLLSIFSPEHRDLNAVYRQQQLDGLLSLVRDAPWHGFGLTASAQVSSTGVVGVTGENSVATNWVLGLLADASLLAWPFFAVLLILLLLRFRTVGAQLLLMVLINSLFSNLLFSPIMWIALGFALSSDGVQTTALQQRGSRAVASRGATSGV